MTTGRPHRPRPTSPDAPPSSPAAPARSAGVLADALAAAGARVVVVDLDASACAAARGRAAGVQATCRSPRTSSIRRAWRHVVDAVTELGACDVLVNNAAFTGTSGVPGYAVPFDEQTDEAFAMALALNLTAPFSLTRRLAPLLRAGGHGSVVNVSSIYGLVGPNMGLYAGTRMGNPAAYAASKGGLAQLTRYLSTVLAPEVRVNAFAPGGIARGPGRRVRRALRARSTPLGRMGTEDDFRGVVTWLASDASAYVTGQVVAVDGGWTAW